MTAAAIVRSESTTANLARRRFSTACGTSRESESVIEAFASASYFVGAAGTAGWLGGASPGFGSQARA